VLRSVGENPESAHALGFAVRRIRIAAVVVGEALCGLASAYVSKVLAKGVKADQDWKDKVNFFVKGVEGRVPTGK